MSTMYGQIEGKSAFEPGCIVEPGCIHHNHDCSINKRSKKRRLHKRKSHQRKYRIKDFELFDLNLWLQHNRLEKFQQYFDDNQVTLDDLITLKEQDILDVIEDINVTASVYIKRFRKCIKKLQHRYKKYQKRKRRKSKKDINVRQAIFWIQVTGDSEQKELIESKVSQVINEIKRRDNDNFVAKICNVNQNNLRDLYDELTKVTIEDVNQLENVEGIIQIV